MARGHRGDDAAAPPNDVPSTQQSSVAGKNMPPGAGLVPRNGLGELALPLFFTRTRERRAGMFVPNYSMAVRLENWAIPFIVDTILEVE
jgi:hypothetical protein